MGIAPGSMIAVEIASTPRSQSALKTLYRICAKDPAVSRLHRQQKSKRPSRRHKQRGGRLWHHQMRSRPAARLRPGDVYTVRATVDTLRDLESVRQYVKLTPA